MDILQKLRLIASGHWTGMGRDWAEKVAGEAAVEIESMQKRLDRWEPSMKCSSASTLAQSIQPSK